MIYKIYKRDIEVDFIVHTTNATNLPVEVKYRNKIEKKYLRGIEYFIDKEKSVKFGLVITKQWADTGTIFGNVAIPLPLYLILMG
jgi:predicted AAA+ superfamily ATPase